MHERGRSHLSATSVVSCPASLWPGGSASGGGIRETNSIRAKREYRILSHPRRFLLSHLRGVCAPTKQWPERSRSGRPYLLQRRTATSSSYWGSIGDFGVGLTLRFPVESGAAVAEVPTRGSLIGAGVGLTLLFVVVPLGAALVDLPIVGSFMGAAVGSTFRLTVVRLVPRVGDTPADLLVPRLTSGLAVGLIAPAPRPPRCATPTPVRSPSSKPVSINFFIRDNLLFTSVARQVVGQMSCQTTPFVESSTCTARDGTTWKNLYAHLLQFPTGSNAKKDRRIAPPALDNHSC